MRVREALKFERGDPARDETGPGRITIKIMIKIKSCRFQSKAPEKTGALQKLRQFVATWRGAGPQMDGNSYVVNSSLTDSLRVESITALSSPR